MVKQMKMLKRIVIIVVSLLFTMMIMNINSVKARAYPYYLLNGTANENLMKISTSEFEPGKGLIESSWEYTSGGYNAYDSNRIGTQGLVGDDDGWVRVHTALLCVHQKSSRNCNNI